MGPSLARDGLAISLIEQVKPLPVGVLEWTLGCLLELAPKTSLPGGLNPGGQD